MAIRDLYGPQILAVLKDKGVRGATSTEILKSIEANSTWGVRAALNRLYRKSRVAKKFVYEPAVYRRRDGATVQNMYGKRVLMYFLPQFRPAGEDVMFIEPKGLQQEKAAD